MGDEVGTAEDVVEFDGTTAPLDGEDADADAAGEGEGAGGVGEG